MKNYNELARALIDNAKKYSPDKMRTTALDSLAQYIKEKISAGRPVRLNFICTHNSRRSHFGQVMAQVLATYLKIPEVYTYSGGTEATAFHPNAVAALQGLGVDIEKQDDSKNPRYRIITGGTTTEAFSRIFSQYPNPQDQFAAIMVCSSADAGCPFVPGAEKRISLPFEDPKISDGTPEQGATYRASAWHIGTELAWALIRA